MFLYKCRDSKHCEIKNNKTWKIIKILGHLGQCDKSEEKKTIV